jgi:hypothetical protein
MGGAEGPAITPENICRLAEALQAALQTDDPSFRRAYETCARVA